MKKTENCLMAEQSKKIANSKIFIPRLPQQITAVHLKTLFSKIGEVVDIFLSQPTGSHNYSYSFIRYENTELAMRAIQTFHNTIQFGIKMNISFAKVYSNSVEPQREQTKLHNCPHCICRKNHPVSQLQESPFLTKRKRQNKKESAKKKLKIRPIFENSSTLSQNIQRNIQGNGETIKKQVFPQQSGKIGVGEGEKDHLTSNKAKRKEEAYSYEVRSFSPLKMEWG